MKIKFTDGEKLKGKPKDFADYVTLVNKIYELQGKKVNADIPITIASEIVAYGYSKEQLEIATDKMKDIKFHSLGLPDFLQFLREVTPEKRETIYCGLCGKQQGDSDIFVSTGMITALKWNPKEPRPAFSVGEAKILCSCEHGQRLRKKWYNMVIHDGKSDMLEYNGWIYVVFFQNDPDWLDKMLYIKDRMLAGNFRSDDDDSSSEQPPVLLLPPSTETAVDPIVEALDDIVVSPQVTAAIAEIEPPTDDDSEEVKAKKIDDLIAKCLEVRKKPVKDFFNT